MFLPQCTTDLENVKIYESICHGSGLYILERQDAYADTSVLKHHCEIPRVRGINSKGVDSTLHQRGCDSLIDLPDPTSSDASRQARPNTYLSGILSRSDHVSCSFFSHLRCSFPTFACATTVYLSWHSADSVCFLADNPGPVCT